MSATSRRSIRSYHNPEEGGPYDPMRDSYNRPVIPDLPQPSPRSSRHTDRLSRSHGQVSPAGSALSRNSFVPPQAPTIHAPTPVFPTPTFPGIGTTLTAPPPSPHPSPTTHRTLRSRASRRSNRSRGDNFEYMRIDTEANEVTQPSHQARPDPRSSRPWGTDLVKGFVRGLKNLRQRVLIPPEDRPRQRQRMPRRVFPTPDPIPTAREAPVIPELPPDRPRVGFSKEEDEDEGKERLARVQTPYVRPSLLVDDSVEEDEEREHRNIPQAHMSLRYTLPPSPPGPLTPRSRKGGKWRSLDNNGHYQSPLRAERGQIMDSGAAPPLQFPEPGRFPEPERPPEPERLPEPERPPEPDRFPVPERFPEPEIHRPERTSGDLGSRTPGQRVRSFGSSKGVHPGPLGPGYASGGARYETPKGTPFTPRLSRPEQELEAYGPATMAFANTKQASVMPQPGFLGPPEDSYDEDATVVQHDEAAPPTIPAAIPISAPVPTHPIPPELAPASGGVIPAYMEIHPSAAAAMSPETMVPSPASDYDQMAYSLRTPSELSLRTAMGHLVSRVKAIGDMPWVSSSRITDDYVPGYGTLHDGKLSTAGKRVSKYKRLMRTVPTWNSTLLDVQKPTERLNLLDGESPQMPPPPPPTARTTRMMEAGLPSMEQVLQNAGLAPEDEKSRWNNQQPQPWPVPPRASTQEGYMNPEPVSNYAWQNGRNDGDVPDGEYYYGDRDRKGTKRVFAEPRRSHEAPQEPRYPGGYVPGPWPPPQGEYAR